MGVSRCGSGQEEAENLIGGHHSHRGRDSKPRLEVVMVEEMRRGRLDNWVCDGAID